MGYSAAVFLCAALYVLKHPLAFLITWSPPSAEAGMLPDVLVSVSAGFFGFQLWALVCTRCAHNSGWQRWLLWVPAWPVACTTMNAYWMESGACRLPRALFRLAT